MLCGSSPKVKEWHGYFSVSTQGTSETPKGLRNDAAYRPKGQAKAPKGQNN